MKLKHFFTALILFAVLVITSCKTSSEKNRLLARKWKVVDAKSAMLTPEAKAKYMSEGNMIEFKEDGNYTGWSKGRENDKGTYTLSEDGKTLIVKAFNKPNSTIIVKELTKDKLIASTGTLDFIFEPFK